MPAAAAGCTHLAIPPLYASVYRGMLFVTGKPHGEAVLAGKHAPDRAHGEGKCPLF